MIAVQRGRKILSLLEERKYLSVSKLSQMLFVSESTVRRDLDQLARQGLIRRTRGGALLVQESQVEMPLSYKSEDNAEKKRYIADLAVDFVQDDQSLFIDSSSTCISFARRLSEKKGLTILTNGLVTAHILSENMDVDVYSAPGQVFKKRASIHGAETCEYILRHFADVAFVSCRGLDTEIGASDYSEGDAMVKRCFRKKARQMILLADSSKFNKSFFHQALFFDQIDLLISDKEPPQEIMQKLIEAEVEVLWE